MSVVTDNLHKIPGPEQNGASGHFVASNEMGRSRRDEFKLSALAARGRSHITENPEPNTKDIVDAPPGFVPFCHGQLDLSHCRLSIRSHI